MAESLLFRRGMKEGRKVVAMLFLLVFVRSSSSSLKTILSCSLIDLARANALLTYALTILALMCTIASFSDNFNFPSPSVEIQVLNFNWFQKQPHGNDE
ncbi:hypothetical protein OIU76_002959, partial [Salix suchowensis]